MRAIYIAFPLLLTSATAFTADNSSVTTNSGKAVNPASAGQVNALANGAAAGGLWCDSFGYQWQLGGAGRTGPTINLAGAANNMCGSSPAAGTLTLTSGLPLDVTATVNPGCFCNQFHEMVLTFDKSTGMFSGTAFTFGGCEFQAPVTLGRC